MSDSSFLGLQIDEVLEEGVGDLKDKIPVLLVLNKRDLIKPGEIAKKLEVCIFYLHYLHETLGRLGGWGIVFEIGFMCQNGELYGLKAK